MISIYADGSSGAGGGKPGGYGYVIVKDAYTPNQQELAWGYGGSPSTTNNLMEMEGATQGLLKAIELGLHDTADTLELVCDSQYALGIASGEYDPKKNLQEACRLREVAIAAGCRFRWVRGHQGEELNEACVQLAGRGKVENTPPELLAKQQAKKAKKSKAKENK